MRDAIDTSFCKDADILRVKLVVANAGDGGGPFGRATKINVSR